jgi:hypothetical protein
MSARFRAIPAPLPFTSSWAIWDSLAGKLVEHLDHRVVMFSTKRRARMAAEVMESEEP